MKEFNLLKEEHGIRARLKELNSSDERRIDTGFIFIALLFITVAVLSYTVYSMSNLGVTAKTERRIPDSKSFKPKTPAPDFQESNFKSEPRPPLSLTKDGDKSKDINEELERVISGVSQPEKEDIVKKGRERFGIRVATCVLKESADVVQRDLKGKGFSSYQRVGSGSIKGKITNLYKIYVGDYSNKEAALSIADKLKAKGFSVIIEEIKNGEG